MLDNDTAVPQFSSVSAAAADPGKCRREEAQDGGRQEHRSERVQAVEPGAVQLPSRAAQPAQQPCAMLSRAEMVQKVRLSQSLDCEELSRMTVLIEKR